MYNGSQQKEKKKKRTHDQKEYIGEESYEEILHKIESRILWENWEQQNQLFLSDRKYSGFLLCFDCFTSIHFPLFIAP